MSRAGWWAQLLGAFESCRRGSGLCTCLMGKEDRKALEPEKNYNPKGRVLKAEEMVKGKVLSLHVAALGGTMYGSLNLPGAIPELRES